ncbi:MAG: hypothetical protein DRN49_01165 [Thaumarchaeota archaeon]|nr:MAG: hypothetical protein DRN49_01165 [Nitrososphaerota archaeon]
MRDLRLEWISERFELALLLELSTTPKPGLIDRIHDYRETSYHHFLASTVSLRSWMRRAAGLGDGRGLGKIIFEGVKAFMNSQRGGNTHLGTWLLIAPMASAAGSHKRIPIKSRSLHFRIKRILRSMDWRDTINVFKAIAYVSPSGLGHVPYLDVLREETYDEIREKKITPLQALSVYKDYDVVAHEWATGYSWVLGDCLRILKKNVHEIEDLNAALVQTFLEILARHKDTHIVRRAGRSAAEIVSSMASKVLELGGILTPAGRKALTEFDRRLRRSRRLRPGSSADLLSASLSALLLEGFNP